MWTGIGNSTAGKRATPLQFVTVVDPTPAAGKTEASRAHLHSEKKGSRVDALDLTQAVEVLIRRE